MKNNGFFKRTSTMLKVDFRRMFTIPFFYILLGISFVIPILILVMTSMMDGTVSVDPQTKEETIIKGFDYVWQIFGTTSTTGVTMDMSITSMCNINMMYFAIAVLVCIFVSEDFKSGYAKNLFSVRSKKTDYIISKTLVCYVGTVIMFVMFVVGAMLGGVVSNVQYDMIGFNSGNILACLFSKIFLCLIFVGTSVLAAVLSKARSWLSLILSVGFDMLFFTMIPMISPLDSTFINVMMTFGGGVLFAIGMGAVSNIVLKKTSLV